MNFNKKKDELFSFSSPKYILLWFIPMIDLQWTIPQSSSDDNLDTGGKFKIHLFSYFKTLFQMN
jgi:hypothetical protein